MKEVGIDHAADVKQFLEDQMDIEALLHPPCGRQPVVHDQVLIVGDKRNLALSPGVRIDSFVKLEVGQRLHIGTGVHIASFAHVGIGGGTTVIGPFAAVASGGRVISGSNEADAISMSASAPAHMQRVTKKVTTIGAYAVVLTNATVLPGVTLHEGAVLAAGGVATKDIPAWEIWGGVPARFIAKRRTR